MVRDDVPPSRAADSTADADDADDDTDATDAAGEPREVDQPRFWQALYDRGGDGWELGGPAPPLAAWLRSPGFAALAVGDAVVPGCGRGHEVLLLAELGWRVVGVDFADAAIAAGRERVSERGLGDRASFVRADWFARAAGPDWQRRFDLVLEHTCYCAIDPGRRDEYAAGAARVLRPGGRFVGLFWACGRDGGPPWRCHPRELERRFGRHFRIARLEPAAGSVPRREGAEWLMIATR